MKSRSRTQDSLQSPKVNPWLDSLSLGDMDTAGQCQVIEQLVKEASRGVVVDKHWLLDHKAFQTVVYGTIIANSIQMGVAIDYPDWTVVWTAFENVFTSIFLCELLIKLFFLRGSYFSDGWNRSDFILVWMSVLDNWIIGLLSADDDSNFSQLSVLRILRILRVARLARLLKVFKELYIILKGMFDSLKTLLWVCLLFVLTMYVFSILCVEVIGRKESQYPGWSDEASEVDAGAEVDDWNNYLLFGTITRSMFTLFFVVLGEEAPTVMRPSFERQSYMVLVFLVLFVFISFGVMNVLIGMLVESTNEAAREMERCDIENHQKEQLKILFEIREMVFKLDENKDGKICKTEMAKGWEDPNLRNLLLRVDLPAGFSSDELLSLLDNDGTGTLTFDQFIRSFYRMIAGDPFQEACCMHSSLNEVRKDCKELRRKLDSEVKMIKDELSSVSSSVRRIEKSLIARLQSEPKLIEPDQEVIRQTTLLV